MHARLRTATLRHDPDGQATLLNLLLRNYLHYSLYDQAEKLVSKSVFPEQANNNEWARYLYYTGEPGPTPRPQGVSGFLGANFLKLVRLVHGHAFGTLVCKGAGMVPFP